MHKGTLTQGEASLGKLDMPKAPRCFGGPLAYLLTRCCSQALHS